MSSEEMQDFKRGLEEYGLYSILSKKFANVSKKFSLSQKITSNYDTKMYHLMYAVHQVLGNCKALFMF